MQTLWLWCILVPSTAETTCGPWLGDNTEGQEQREKRMNAVAGAEALKACYQGETLLSQKK